MAKERVYKWDNLKFMLIFLVVFGHCIEGFLDSSDTLKATWLYIYSFHMPIFVFVSGLFCKSAIRDESKCKRKIFSYIKIYFYFKIAIIAFELLVRGEGKFSVFSESSVPWYLLAMAIWMYVTSKIKDKDPNCVMFAAVIFALAQGYDREINEFLTLGRVFAFYPCFYLGYIIKPEKVVDTFKNNKFLSNIFVKITGMAIVLAGYIFTIKNIDWMYNVRPLLTGKNSYFSIPWTKWGFFLRMLNYMWAAFVGVVLIMIAPNVKTFFTKWGARTLTIYILHSIIYRTLRAAGYEAWIKGLLPDHWIYVVVLVPFVLIVLLSWNKFDKVIVKIMNNDWSIKPSQPLVDTGKIHETVDRIANKTSKEVAK